MLGAAGEYDDRSGLALPAESPAPTLPVGIGDRRTTLDLQRRSLVLSSRVGYSGDRGYARLSGYASGLTRGGDLAHWAQLTATPDGSRGTKVALGQFRVNLDTLLKASQTFNLALQSTYFQGGILPPDRVEIASDLFYVERQQAYRGVDSMLEARFTPSSRLSLITGVEALYDHETIGAPQRINRATGEPVLSGGTDRTADLRNLGAYASVNYKLLLIQGSSSPAVCATIGTACTARRSRGVPASPHACHRRSWPSCCMAVHSRHHRRTCCTPSRCVPVTWSATRI